MHALPIIALVIAVAAYLRAHRGSSWAGCDRGHRGWRHGGGCHGGWRAHRWRHARRRGPRALLYSIIARLDLTPAQDRAVRGEFLALRDKLGQLRGEGERSRGDVAAALRGEAFEDSALDAMFARHDERLAEVRRDLGAALRRVHELLDPEQRERLADLIAGDWRAHGFRGPYR